MIVFKVIWEKFFYEFEKLAFDTFKLSVKLF